MTIELPCPQAAGLSPAQYEVVGHKESHRLAQRPGAYVVLKYRRAVIKRGDTHTLHCASAPVGVIEGSRADISFAAGVLVDKFQWHLPLYRQHQRLEQAGFKLTPPVADQPGRPKRCAGAADLRRAARIDPALPRQGGGRDADQGRPSRARQAARGLLLACVRRARRCNYRQPASPTSARASIATWSIFCGHSNPRARCYSATAMAPTRPMSCPPFFVFQGSMVSIET